MTQLTAITKNAFLQTVRQPVFGIIVIVTLSGIAMAPSLTGWTLDDDNKMLRDIGLSTLLIQGLFLGCFAASSVLNTEIEDKTVLSVAVKPVSRWNFVLGKYLGVAGGLLAAHYLATIAFFMAMRHGVLQTARDTSDLTVIFLGPVAMALVAIIAAVLNYLYDWRFLVTFFSLAVPVLTIGAAILLVIDRNGNLKSFEVTQEIVGLPAEITGPEVLDGVISFRPYEGESWVKGHKGVLVRKSWQGPISKSEREFLLGLSEAPQWQRNVRFLTEESRDFQDTEVFKSCLLVLVAVMLLAGIAVTCSTRLGTIATLVICVIAVSAGLAANQVIKPVAEQGATWAKIVYPLVPNFQVFWMIDALSEDRVIPWDYIGHATGYGLTYLAAVLLLGMALFETREVG